MLVIITVKTITVKTNKSQRLDLKILLVSDIKSSQIISSITKKMQQGITWCGNNLRDSLVAVSLGNDEATETKTHFLQREAWLPGTSRGGTQIQNWNSSLELKKKTQHFQEEWQILVINVERHPISSGSSSESSEEQIWIFH